MAIANIGTLKGVGSAIAGTASLAVTTLGATLPVGTLVVLGTAGVSGVSGVADNSTQAGTANSYTVRTTITQGAGGNITVAWCILTRSLLTTDTITITFSFTSSRCAARFSAWSGVDPSPLDANANAGVTASPLSVGPTGTLAGTGELAICHVGWLSTAVASGVVDTAGFTLASTSSGGATSRVEAIEAHNLGVGTAAQTDAMTFTSITSAAGEILTFKALAAAATARSESVVVRRTWAGA